MERSAAADGEGDAAQPVAPQPSARRFSARAITILGAVAVVVFLIDQLAKALVISKMQLDQEIRLLGGLLTFRYVRNPGAAFSIGAGSTWIFTIIAIAVLVFVVWYAPRIRSIGWAIVFGLLLGGLAGNLSDRLFRPPAFGQGEVIDFIKIPLLPAIFNLADVSICAAMALFIILTLRGVGLDGRRSAGHPDDTKPTPAGDDHAQP